MDRFAREHETAAKQGLGCLIAHLVEHSEVYGMMLSCVFSDVNVV